MVTGSPERSRNKNSYILCVCAHISRFLGVIRRSILIYAISWKHLVFLSGLYLRCRSSSGPGTPHRLCRRLRPFHWECGLIFIVAVFKECPNWHCGGLYFLCAESWVSSSWSCSSLSLSPSLSVPLSLSIILWQFSGLDVFVCTAFIKHRFHKAQSSFQWSTRLRQRAFSWSM